MKPIALLFTCISTLLLAAAPLSAADQPFRAGAAVVDITPLKFPVIANGMFTERLATQAVDRLHARCLALDDGSTKLALCVVDICLMPRDVVDRAKDIAAQATGLGPERMMISATHTHSGGSVMGCLGSRADPDYTTWLPAKLAEAIIAALKNLQPARIGWASVDAWEHTHNRVWIRRPETMLIDPFGNRTVRAMMQPGYLSPDIIGPSGPVDPGLSVLAVQTPEGKPLALMGNYSQHYFGSPLLSADCYGAFSRHIAKLLGQASSEGPFVAMLSQGTSGDLMWMDFGSPRKPELTLQTYSEALAQRGLEAYQRIVWHNHVPLGMVQKAVPLNYRVPDAERLAWAKQQVAALQGKLPTKLPDIYAHEAILLHEKQKTTVLLQAIRIGDLTISALETETYAITGLKLKAQAPLGAHFNIELANGEEGYIPPPEIHPFGGYNTWPARSAGLEVQAETKIVEAMLGALEEVTGRKRRVLRDEHGAYAKAVLAAKPAAYWRLNDIEGTTAANAVAGGPPASISEGFGWYLPGIGSGTGIGAGEKLTASAFSGPNQINRAVQLAGGDLRADLGGLGASYSIALWFWLGEASGASERTGTLVTGPGGESLTTRQAKDHRVQLVLNGAASLLGLRADDWHFAVLVRDGNAVRVHWDGGEKPQLSALLPAQKAEQKLVFGHDLQGKLDEIAVFHRALAPAEIAALWKVSGQSSVVAQAAAPPQPRPASEPLAPLESLKKIHVPAGFRVELVAAEPLVLDPVAFDWDERGRLWVVEMADYPLGMDGKGKPGGRVRILSDTDGDGRYDHATLFADGLNFPTGIITWRDGAIVTAAPEILFLKDSDGDGKADVREPLFQGFSEGNQQLRVNGLRWGLDNWIYCAAGSHHAGYAAATKLKSVRTGAEFQVGSRDFRFRPDTGELEAQSGPSQFGRNRDDWGRWFGTQNIRPLWHFVLTDHYLRRNPHVAAPNPTRMVVVPLSPKVWPASPQEKRFHSFNEAGHFTSACAGMIYRDELLFARNAESHAFTCEPFHNLVQHNVLTDDGVSFTAHRAPGEATRDFFASEDRWCRPVMTRTGPDGALWVADMYRYMIEHPQWLPQNGKDELQPHFRLGDDRGRIYRVVPANAPARQLPTLDRLEAAGLVAALDSPNGWQRDKAQQLLLWRNDRAAIPHLEALAVNSGNPRARLHALCALDGLGALSAELVERALADAHPGVRENALRLAEPRGTPSVVAAAARLVSDGDAKVRLQLAYALGQWSDPRAGAALGQLAVANHSDHFLTAAVMSSALPHARAMVEAVAKAGGSALPALLEPLLNLALGLNDRVALARLVQPVLTSAGRFSPEQVGAFSRLLDALAQRKLSLAELRGTGSDELSQLLANGDALLAQARESATQASLPAADRIAAASLLSRDPVRRVEASNLLAGWLTPQSPADAQPPAIRALAATGAADVPARFAKAWPALGPAARQVLLDEWLAREPWALNLLQRIEKEELGAAAIDPARRARLLRHDSGRVRTLAGKVFDAAATPSRAKVVENFSAALKLAGQAAKGREIYLRACAVCHKRGAEGKEVGPDLLSVVIHPPEKLLLNILDPNIDIQPGFHAYTCVLGTGEEIYGLVVAETGNSITMKLPDGTARTVTRNQIASLRGGNLSLMPEGLEAGLTKQDMADLIAFLRTPEPGGKR